MLFSPPALDLPGQAQPDQIGRVRHQRKPTDVTMSTADLETAAQPPREVQQGWNSLPAPMSVPERGSPLQQHLGIFLMQTLSHPLLRGFPEARGRSATLPLHRLLSPKDAASQLLSSNQPLLPPCSPPTPKTRNGQAIYVETVVFGEGTKEPSSWNGHPTDTEGSLVLPVLTCRAST